MYRIRSEEYVPLPRPATSDRIVAAHYYAAWKKGAAGIHNGFDDLHAYPDRTPLCGYYDEERPAYADFEIKWALEHGINCFIHCWYRKPENEGKPVTVADLRCSHALHEALFNARYGDMMKFAIMFENSPRWGSTNTRDLVENLMPFWCEHYFKRKNYLVIDNKPVLLLFYIQRFAEIWKDPCEQAAAFDACRAYAKAQGFDGMIFAACSQSTPPEEYAEMMARGYDFRLGYTTPYRPAEHHPPEREVIEGQITGLAEKLRLDPMRFLPTASCFWDPTPRFSKHWIDLGYDFHKTKIWHLSPEGFREVLHKMKKMTDALPDGAWGKRIFVLDNWNEWDEGHFIAPSHAYGFQYLQAVREELSARDNLPDYRTPQDMGLSGLLNKSWDEPDFSKSH